MSYSPQTWHDISTPDTPLSAPRMQHADDGILEQSNRLDVHDTRGVGYAPSYAGGLARTRYFEARISAYNARAANIRRLHAALARARSGAGSGYGRLLFVGDSLLAGQQATPGVSDPVHRLAQLFRAQNFAVGEMVFVENYVGTRDARWNVGAGWVDFSTFVQANTNGAVMTYTSDNVGTVVEIATSGQGTGFTYSIDGATPVTYTPPATNATQRIVVSGLPNTTHQVVITSTGTTTYFQGVAVLPSTGLVIANSGISGAKTADWTPNTWSDGIPARMDSLGSVDVVFFELGANDYHATPTPVSASTVYSNLTTIATNIAGRGADMVIIAPHRFNDSDPGFNPYLSVMYDVADMQDIALLDITDSMGSYADLQSFGQTDADGIHLTPAGYSRKANCFLGFIPQPLGIQMPTPLDVGLGFGYSGGDTWDYNAYGDVLSNGYRDDASGTLAMSSSIRTLVVYLGYTPVDLNPNGLRAYLTTAMAGGTPSLALFYANSMTATSWTRAGSAVTPTLTSTGVMQVADAVAIPAGNHVIAQLVLTGTAPTTYPVFAATPAGQAAFIARPSGGAAIAGTSSGTTAPGTTLNPTTGFTNSTQKPWMSLY